MHAFRAPHASSGKSFLVDLVAAIATGKLCPVAAAGRTEEEAEKRIVALLLSGIPIVSVDNLNGELGGEFVCQAIERLLIRVRPLGRSESIEIENRATLFATGIGLTVRADATRRVLVGNLDLEKERPEQHRFAGDPMKAVMADRGRYVAGCLTIVRAYLAAGSPGRLPPPASFGEWSNLVRSALVWLGCADPWRATDATMADDPETAELRELLTLWRETFGLNTECWCGKWWTPRSAASERASMEKAGR